MISGVIAARALGVEGRGTLAILWLIPVTLVLLGGIGIPQATTFYVARQIENARGVVRDLGPDHARCWPWSSPRPTPPGCSCSPAARTRPSPMGQGFLSVGLVPDVPRPEPGRRDAARAEAVPVVQLRPAQPGDHLCRGTPDPLRDRPRLAHVDPRGHALLLGGGRGQHLGDRVPEPAVEPRAGPDEHEGGGRVRSARE